MNRPRKRVVLLGATGSIGSVSARLLAMAFDEVVIAARDLKKLEEHGVKRSMSRKRNPWDNAVIESFFSTLRFELQDQRMAGQVQHCAFYIAGQLTGTGFTLYGNARVVAHLLVKACKLVKDRCFPYVRVANKGYFYRRTGH